MLGDAHIPFHDRKCLELIKSTIKDLHYDGLVINGDWIDFYEVSRYIKNPGRLQSLQRDIDSVVADLTEWRELLGIKAKIHYIPGNHDERLRKYIYSTAPELSTLRFLDLRELLKLNELNINFYDYRYGFKKNGFLFIHGELARKWSGYTAKGSYEKYNTSGIVNHVHRLGAFYRRDTRGTHAFFENGCLCDLDPDYSSPPTDWQHGFSIVTFIGKWWYVQQVPIFDHQFILNGKLYK